MGGGHKTFVDVGYSKDYNEDLAFTFKDSVALRSVLQEQDIMDITMNLIKEGQYTRQKNFIRTAPGKSPFGSTQAYVYSLDNDNISSLLFNNISDYIAAVWGISISLVSDGTDPSYVEEDVVDWNSKTEYGTLPLWYAIHKYLYVQYDYNEYNPKINILRGDPAVSEQWNIVKNYYSIVSSDATNTNVDVTITRDVTSTRDTVIGQDEAGNDITIQEEYTYTETSSLNITVPTPDADSSYAYGTLWSSDIVDSDNQTILHVGYIKDLSTSVAYLGDNPVVSPIGNNINIGNALKIAPYLPIKTPSLGYVADSSKYGEPIRNLIGTLGSDLDGITNSLKGTSSIYAAIYQLGVPLNASEPSQKEYLFEFFTSLEPYTASSYNERLAAVDAYNEWVDTRVTETISSYSDGEFTRKRVYTPSAPSVSYPMAATSIKIRESGYNIDFAYAYIVRKRGTNNTNNKLGSVSISIVNTLTKPYPTIPSYDADGYYSSELDPNYDPYTDLLDGLPKVYSHGGSRGTFGLSNRSTGVDITLTKYISSTETEIVIVRNFSALSEIKGKIYSYTSTSTDKPIIIPLCITPLDNMRFYSREAVCDRSRQIYAFAAVRKSTGGFLSFIFSFILAIVITIIFPPAGGFAWSAVFTTFAVSVAISIAMQVIMSAFPDNIIVQAIAIIAIAYFTMGIGTGGGWSELTTAKQIVIGANVSSQIYSAYTNIELRKMAEQFEQDYNKYAEEIEEQEKQLDDHYKGFFMYMRAKHPIFMSPDTFFAQYGAELDTTEASLNLDALLLDDVSHMLL